MRLLAISDIHTNIENLTDIVDHAKTHDFEFDMIIIVGDISSNTERISETANVPLVESIAKLLLPLAPTYAILGNDDHPSLEKLLEENGIVSMENKIINLEKWSFVGWGGTVNKTVLTKYNGEVSVLKVEGINTWEDEIVKLKLAPTLENIDPERFLCVVSHYHPTGVFFARKTDRFPQVGSNGLKDILNQFKPKLWLCAHVHSQTGMRLIHQPTQTLFIRVTSVVTGYDRYKKRNFGKAYWILDLDDEGNIKTKFYELVAQDELILY